MENHLKSKTSISIIKQRKKKPPVFGDTDGASGIAVALGDAFTICRFDYNIKHRAGQ